MTKTLLGLYKAYKKYNRYKKTVRELAVLSDRDLADLGISRADIPYVARKSVYRGLYA
jgi:uncharacterized protein YjiS (DUF1127 family)